VDSYFQQTIFPALTPLAFDPGRPFPHISNLSLNLAVMLRAAKAKSILRESRFPIRCRNWFGERRCKTRSRNSLG